MKTWDSEPKDLMHDLRPRLISDRQRKLWAGGRVAGRADGRAADRARERTSKQEQAEGTVHLAAASEVNMTGAFG